MCVGNNPNVTSFSRFASVIDLRYVTTEQADTVITALLWGVFIYKYIFYAGCSQFSHFRYLCIVAVASRVSCPLKKKKKIFHSLLPGQVQNIKVEAGKESE